jgi:hypothetical protein
VLHGETIAILQAWEEQFPVLDWTVDGLHVWPMIRTRLASRLLAAGAPAQRRGLRHWCRSLLAAAPPRGNRATTLRRVPRADAVFLGRPASRQLLDGTWYDRLLDPLADILENQGHRVLPLEYRPTGTRRVAPRARAALDVRSAITRRNIAAALRPVRSSRQRLEGFSAFTRAVTQTRMSVRPVSRRWVVRQARSIDAGAGYFGAILRQTGARLACCSVYYTLVGMAFCLAARRAGIPSVDVQHGVTVGNPAYEGWGRIPHEGFDVLPSVFWCWSEQDAGAVGGWPEHARTCHRAVIGGHPWLALWRADHPRAVSLRQRLPPRTAASLIVLVTLSWSSGFSARLKTLVADAPADWDWWIRLHPLMEGERASIRAWCEQRAPGRARVDEPTDLPLPLLLESIDVHVTHNSTVVQEAARLGTPSVVVDTRALDVYAAELRSGWAVCALDSAAALAAIRDQRRRRDSLVRPAPYPSWAHMARTLRDLLDSSPDPCPATAPAASSPTAARA